MSNIIYTIGHSTILVEELFDLLKQYNITTLADIRSVPYSQFASQFNREPMEQLCHRNGINYLFLGDSLGGKPGISSVGNNGSKMDYDYISQQNYYLLGIDKLLSLIGNYRICLMCSEGLPDKCHRNLLVSKTLEKEGISVLHILPDGKTINSSELNLIKNKGQLVLF
ncbi:MAG: hypothetical protein FD145_1503 [Candidatus Saganbacteria bacterium]|uniref:DUF488 domain-containing protein n=1 Tax=Candidatus Saganbacteria bacterium TaxID=2575572 RepID=A0A833KZX0_UNCSA|nr:MAG: hypothetical protein FD145_1503 [Candidatus Saganbacteria bacterium]